MVTRYPCDDLFHPTYMGATDPHAPIEIPAHPCQLTGNLTPVTELLVLADGTQVSESAWMELSNAINTLLDFSGQCDIMIGEGLLPDVDQKLFDEVEAAVNTIRRLYNR